MINVPSANASMMIELLVSVRDLREAKQVAGESVDILDLKEPSAGPLAAVTAEVWQSVASFVGELPAGQMRLSAALGEQDSALEIARSLPGEFHYAKVGPSGCMTPQQLERVWRETLKQLSADTELVAVAYADHKQAQCLDTESIIRLAADVGLRRVLVDTFVKDGRSSIDHLTTTGLQSVRNLTEELNLRWMLAGSIRERELGEWLAVDTCPDGIGLRGDLCRAGRASDMDPERVAVWRAALNRFTETRPNRVPSAF